MSKCTKYGAPTLYGDRMKQTATFSCFALTCGFTYLILPQPFYPHSLVILNLLAQLWKSRKLPLTFVRKCL
jgi:hypothetical protein